MPILRGKQDSLIHGIQSVFSRVAGGLYWRTTHFIRTTVEPQIGGFSLSDLRANLHYITSGRTFVQDQESRFCLDQQAP